MFIQDPESEFFHPGSRIKKIPNPRSGSTSKKLSIFNRKKLFLNSRTYIWSGMFIPIRILIFYPSRIPVSNMHRIPDPDSHATLEKRTCDSGAASMRLCQVLVEFGITNPKSKLHSSKHRPGQIKRFRIHSYPIRVLHFTVVPVSVAAMKMSDYKKIPNYQYTALRVYHLMEAQRL